MEFDEETKLLINGLDLLGVTPEIITAIISLCDTKDKKNEMMLFMADEIDAGNKLTESDLLHKAVKISEQ